jgi:asparagine synthase (glutamine-hydrolysing)
MCGVCGELRFDGAAADAGAVGRMNDAMHRRGPDGAGVWGQGPVALGHRRLKIIDLSERGAQPMVDPDAGLALVFNGCIYNYRELRAELQATGHRFFSHSDSEVVLRAYAAWGPACVERFLGMFAFAVHERETGRLVLGRDRLGIKPLYVTRDAARLRFASSLPALLAGGGVDTSVDPVALQFYLSFHAVVPPPMTVLQGVRKLPPATVRVIEADGSETDTVYWKPSFTRRPQDAGMSTQDWQDALLASLRTAVDRRMVADVPVGVLLSGGFDSSLIVALLAEAGQKDLRTFSIGFDAVGDREGDEFHYSDLVAKHFGTDHQQIRVPAVDMVPSVTDAVAAMSEPMTSHDVVAFYLLSKEVSERVTVVQSGQGADEVLAGYSWYPPLAEVSAGEAVPSYLAAFRDRDLGALGQILSPDWMLSSDAPAEFVAANFGAPGADTAVDRALRIDSTVMLVDDPVKRVDNMTMAWGLEARVPFLDHEFVELCAACPPDLKLSGDGKGVLKDAARQVLPVDVIDRPKGYFPVPALQVLEGGVLEMVRAALTDPAARARGLYRPGYVDQLLASPNEVRSTIGPNTLWQMALLEIWLQGHGIS